MAEDTDFPFSISDFLFPISEAGGRQQEAERQETGAGCGRQVAGARSDLLRNGK